MATVYKIGNVPVGTYGAEYRGIIQYYLLAGDVFRLGRLRWVMVTSMLKTLAGKHRTSAMKMARKHQTTILTPYGRRRCFEVRVERQGRKPLVARFDGIPLRQQKRAVIADRLPAPTGQWKGTELIRRLRAGRCEICEERTRVQVHQVRNLADLATPGQPQPAWAKLMAKRRRKTLVVCPPCHDSIHARQPTTSTG
jgi:hypothetical protein